MIHGMSFVQGLSQTKKRLTNPVSRFLYGRPGRFRTADLYRVKVALSP